MSDFDPGPEWREVERPVAAVAPEAVSYRANHQVRTWVRRKPEEKHEGGEDSYGPLGEPI